MEGSWAATRSAWSFGEKMKPYGPNGYPDDWEIICIGTSVQGVPAANLIPIFSPVKNRYIIDVKTRPPR